ncbi:hypothetical protein CYMTET_13817 [Cymbomonas tetramitiformis]|uniref:Uncharacterized protein n=1 Tax=Cymbomonas tetramitiformis TaxID=36881 RepID=A0AAE0GHR6_9CHLO|nr:hypothetical protein CYMTET_13817 [Cymbomonas tetramitiformis]
MSVMACYITQPSARLEVAGQLKRTAPTRQFQRSFVCKAAHGSEVGSTRSSRRNFAAAVILGPSLLVSNGAALAFGTGFPGYDVNVEARQRATDRQNSELEKQKQLAAEFRAKRKAEAAAKKAADEAEAAAAPAPTPTPTPTPTLPAE